jgi:arabinofuranan 3-O-arabinosyltransferase
VWPLLALLAAACLVRSDALADTLGLGNLSLLLAPIAVGVLLLYETDHWRSGTALLALSLLIKPLLLPLILLPLLRGKWRPVLAAVVGGGALLGLAILFVPGGEHFFAVLRYLEEGSLLTGRRAVYNISIHSLAERLDLSTWGYVAQVIVAVLAVAVAYLWTRRPVRPGGIAVMGTLLLLAAFLAGSLSENHYLLVAVPCLLTGIALGGRLSDVAVAVPGLLLFVLPGSYLGSLGNSLQGLQVRYVIAQLLLAGAAGLAIARSSRVEHEHPSVASP